MSRFFEPKITSPTGHSNLCKSCGKAARRAYYLEHRLYFCEKAATWAKVNREKYNARIRQRRRDNPSVAIAHSCRSRIRSALPKGKGGLKTIQLIGLKSFSELKDYIESMWDSEMSWSNYGHKGWHIDHIVPLASFDLSDDGQLAKALHFSNLQPMWSKENWSKGAHAYAKNYFTLAEVQAIRRL